MDFQLFHVSLADPQSGNDLSKTLLERPHLPSAEAALQPAESVRWFLEWKKVEQLRPFRQASHLSGRKTPSWPPSILVALLGQSYPNQDLP